MNFERNRPDELQSVNPVYPYSFPDPFVLKFEGEYFAYCTGHHSSGRVFGVLRSHDLVTWRDAGGAMEPLTGGQPFYWAPEVTYHNGTFYLYYSVGNEALMELRVAVSDRPDGGFIDSGHKLTTQDFAIDAHVFIDDDGSRYMFYATDFLDYSHIGTGVVVDKMLDWFTLVGDPKPVTRAKYDWQVYDPNRIEKGGVRWHTVEGPFVLKRKGLYYALFSGGNWQNPSYGVSFAVSGEIEREDEWEQFSDGEKTLPILRTIPGKVTGPGHNSVIRGPNNRELYCIYHSWKGDARVLDIDRMGFAGNRIFIMGATDTPQPAPYRPSITFDSDVWTSQGEWRFSDGPADSLSPDGGSLTCPVDYPGFLCEVSFSLAKYENKGSIAVCLESNGRKIVEISLRPGAGSVSFICSELAKRQEHSLTPDFNFGVSHLIKLELNHGRVSVKLDETEVFLGSIGSEPATTLSLQTESTRGRFAGFALSYGFEDLFEEAGADPESLGWSLLEGDANLSIADGSLVVDNGTHADASICKGWMSGDFEFAANLSIAGDIAPRSECGFVVLDKHSRPVFRLNLAQLSGRYYISDPANSVHFALPENFEPRAIHQFRFVKRGEILQMDIEGVSVGSLSVLGNARIAMFTKNAVLNLEMVRLTILQEANI